MSDTELLLSVVCVGLGVYATYQHSLISRYRKWADKASAQLIHAALIMASYEKETEDDTDSE